MKTLNESCDLSQNLANKVQEMAQQLSDRNSDYVLQWISDSQCNIFCNESQEFVDRVAKLIEVADSLITDETYTEIRFVGWKVFQAIREEIEYRLEDHLDIYEPNQVINQEQYEYLMGLISDYEVAFTKK